MAILVTGGAGYIGSVMVDLLNEQRERVIVLDDLVRGHRAALDANLPFYKGRTGDRALVQRICQEHDIESCIHFAAMAYVGESVDDPQLYFEKNVADVSERRMPTKEADVLGLETHVFQEVEGLLESGGKEIASLRRQRAHEEFEAGGGAEAVLKIGRRHGDLVKVREQGRMAKGFGHEEGLWENYRGPRRAVMAFEGKDGLLLAVEVALAPPCVSCARAPLTLSECSDTPFAPFLVCQSKKDWIFTFVLSRTLATPASVSGRFSIG